MRPLITVLLLLFSVVFCNENKTQSTVDSLKELLPEDIAEKLGKLSPDDVKAAKKIFQKLTAKEDLVKELSEQSPALKDLLEAVLTKLHQRKAEIDKALSAETKKFLGKAGTVLEKTFEKLKKLYEEEGETVKEDLRKAFPKLMLVIEHPQIQDGALNLCGCGGGRAPVVVPPDQGLIIPPDNAAFGLFGASLLRIA